MNNEIRYLNVFVASLQSVVPSLHEAVPKLGAENTGVSLAGANNGKDARMSVDLSPAFFAI